MSTKPFGCFFCIGKSLSLDGKCDECGAQIDVSEDILCAKIREYNPVEIIGRGFYGYTLKVQDNMQFFAIKVIPWHRVEVTEADIDREAKALISCSTPPHRHIAKFWQSFKEVVSVLGRDVEVLCLVFEYIDRARPLREVIESEDVELSRTDVVDIIAGIASGLERMHARKFWHNDLHDDNVLVRSVEEDENLPEKNEVKLIDFGSVKPKVIDEPEHGERGDYFYLAKHTYGLVARFEKCHMRELAAADRVFASRLRVLAGQLADSNVSRRNLEPREVIEKIRKANMESVIGQKLQNFEEMLSETKVSIEEPLATTNALSLTTQDIALLYTDSLGWESLLKRSETVIVVGPRGCGKTMLLRYLSIPSQARPRDNERSKEEVCQRLNGLGHVAFLVSCLELRTPFLRSAYKKLEKEDSGLAEDFSREYINAHLALEVGRTIIWMKEEKFAPIENEDDLGPLRSIFAELIGTDSKRPGLREVVETIDRRVITLSNLPDPTAYKPSNLCRDDCLIQICRALKAVPWIRQKTVWILLDDYSPGVLPPFVQRAYNPVVFKVSSELRIKLSSEGDGPILEDNLKRKYKEGRELSKVNLGEIYFQVDEKKGREFIEAILDARFKATGKGSMEQLRGMLMEHPHELNFGSYICKQRRPGDSRFYGFGLLCRLCSGDVSFIIDLLRAIVGGRGERQNEKISPNEQDTITKRFAQRQLADLRRTALYGPHLHDFALNMGNLLKKYLLKSRNKKQIDERLRIEIEGSRDLRPEAQDMHEALLRHSVLIKAGAGKDRKGLPTRKFFFRRLFAPCFPFSPSRGECIPLTVEKYERWLVNPDSILKRVGKDDWDSGLGKAGKANK